MTKKYVRAASILVISLTTFLFSSHVVSAVEQPYDSDQQIITIRLEERTSNHANGGTNGQTNQGTGYLPKTGEIKESKMVTWGIVISAFASILFFYRSRRKRMNP